MKNNKLKQNLTIAALAAILIVGTLCSCRKVTNEEPTPEPTPVATPVPTPNATVTAELTPTVAPTAEPTDAVTPEPTPTVAPTTEPTPTAAPVNPPSADAFVRAARLNAYAEALVHMGMLCTFPEDEHWDDHFGWLNEYSSGEDGYFEWLSEYRYDGESTYNHYVLKDYDGDGLEELIVLIDSDNAPEEVRGIYSYTYNAFKDKVEFFPLNDEIDEDNVKGVLRANKIPLLYENYVKYTKDYIELCLNAGFETRPEDSLVDLGLYYTRPQTKRPEALFAECGLTKNDKAGEAPSFFDYFTNDQNNVVVEIAHLANDVYYLNADYDGFYLFNLKPGMFFDKVADTMRSFHAVSADWNTDEDFSTDYIVGSDAFYYCITVDYTESGYIQRLSVYSGCCFAN